MKMRLVLCFILTNIISLQVFSHDTLPPHISVTGTAVHKVAPDIIYWQLQIRTEGKQLQEVTENHTEQVKNVLSNLHQHNINKENIQTTNMRFDKDHRYENNQRVFKGYYASTNVSFKLDDIKQYEAIWFLLSAYEFVSIESVTYDSSERITIQDKTRIEALLAAKQKAKQLAKAVNTDIGDPILIEEHSSTGVKQSNNRITLSGANPRNKAISVGLIEISMTVKAKFQLETLMHFP